MTTIRHAGARHLDTDTTDFLFVERALASVYDVFALGHYDTWGCARCAARGVDATFRIIESRDCPPRTAYDLLACDTCGAGLVRRWDQCSARDGTDVRWASA